MTNSEQPDSEISETAPEWGADKAGRAPSSLRRWRMPLLAAAVVVIGVAAVLVIQHLGTDDASPRDGMATEQQGDTNPGTEPGQSIADPADRNQQPADAPVADSSELDCGADAANQLSIDDIDDVEGSVRVGITAAAFCAGVDNPADHGSGPVRYQAVALAGTGQLRAVVQTGSGPFGLVAAGLVDRAVTRVVAIRGNEDSEHPRDRTRDRDLDLYEAGADGRVFVADDIANTVAVVLYAGDVEGARSALPVSEVTDMADEAEKYDVRPDLLELKDRPWSAWQRLDESTVRLYFLGGPAVCYGVVVTVQADASAVRIGLRTGWKPETEACTDNLVPSSVDVPLDEPLAGRPVEPLLP